MLTEKELSDKRWNKELRRRRIIEARGGTIRCSHHRKHVEVPLSMLAELLISAKTYTGTVFSRIKAKFSNLFARKQEVYRNKTA